MFASFEWNSLSFVYTGLLVGHGGEKAKFRGIFRDKFVEKGVNFSRIFEANFTEKMIGKKQVILQEFSEQILLESDWFCADLRNGFNETRCS